MRLQSAEGADLVMTAKEYIRTNYTLDITLNDVADHIHISPSYLSRLYKEATGSTVMSDVTNLKIEHTKKHCYAQVLQFRVSQCPLALKTQPRLPNLMNSLVRGRL